MNSIISQRRTHTCELYYYTLDHHLYLGLYYINYISVLTFENFSENISQNAIIQVSAFWMTRTLSPGNYIQNGEHDKYKTFMFVFVYMYI